MSLANFIQEIYEDKYELIQGGIDRVVFRRDDKVYKLDKTKFHEDELYSLGRKFYDKTNEDDYRNYDAFESYDATGEQNEHELYFYNTLRKRKPELLKYFASTESFIDDVVLVSEYCGKTLKRWACDKGLDDLQYGRNRKKFFEENHPEEFSEEEINTLVRSPLSSSVINVATLLHIPKKELLEFAMGVSETNDILEITDLHWDNVCYDGRLRVIDFGYKEHSCSYTESPY